MEIERLTDKVLLTSSSRATQVSLFSHSMDSLLYQEMLSYKAAATQRGDTSMEDSDWEVLSGDNYDGDSEASSISYFSDEGGEGEEDMVAPKSMHGRRSKHRGTLKNRTNGYVGNGFLEEDVNVGYYTPNLSLEEGGSPPQATTDVTRTKQGTGNDEGAGPPRTPPISPKISIKLTF